MAPCCPTARSSRTSDARLQRGFQLRCVTLPRRCVCQCATQPLGAAFVFLNARRRRLRQLHGAWPGIDTSTTTGARGTEPQAAKLAQTPSDINNFTHCIALALPGSVVSLKAGFRFSANARYSSAFDMAACARLASASAWLFHRCTAAVCAARDSANFSRFCSEISSRSLRLAASSRAADSRSCISTNASATAMAAAPASITFGVVNGDMIAPSLLGIRSHTSAALAQLAPRTTSTCRWSAAHCRLHRAPCSAPAATSSRALRLRGLHRPSGLLLVVVRNVVPRCPTDVASDHARDEHVDRPGHSAQLGRFRVEQRIAEILAGKRQPHDVEVMDL